MSNIIVLERPRPKSFVEVMALWPTPKDLADDLSTNVARVYKWRHNDRIPDVEWKKLLAAARARKIKGLDRMLLVGLSEKNGADKPARW